MISRREFLLSTLALGWGVLFTPDRLHGESSFPHFFFTQVRYRAGPGPQPQLCGSHGGRTGAAHQHRRRQGKAAADLTDPALFFSPFLFMAGKYDFEPLAPRERETLRRYLTFGGFLFAEDTLGVKGYGFDRAFRRR